MHHNISSKYNAQGDIYQICISSFQFVRNSFSKIFKYKSIIWTNLSTQRQDLEINMKKGENHLFNKGTKGIRTQVRGLGKSKSQLTMNNPSHRSTAAINNLQHAIVRYAIMQSTNDLTTSPLLVRAIIAAHFLVTDMANRKIFSKNFGNSHNQFRGLLRQLKRWNARARCETNVYFITTQRAHATRLPKRADWRKPDRHSGTWKPKSP